MGLFGGSKSSSNTSTVSNVNQTSENTNISDIEGIGIGSTGGGDITIQSLDGGAIGESFDFAEEVSDGAFSLGERAIDSNLRAVNSSLDLAGDVTSDAIAGITDANDRSLDFGEDALETSFNFGTNLASQSFDFGGKALDAVKTSSEGTAKTLSDAIMKASDATRTDSANTLDKITKTGGIVLAVVAVAVAAAFIFKK